MEPGAQLLHYRVGEPLADLGLEHLVRARDTRSGAEVFLFILPEEATADPAIAARLRRDLEAADAVDHPGVLAFATVQQAGGTVFTVADRVHGVALERWIPGHGALADRVFDLAVELADTIDALHEAGVVHGHLHAGNVLVVEDGRPLVLFTGDLPGGPPLSPEQARGRPVDRRSDVFALGMLLYRLATGRPPFRATVAAELARAVREDDPAPAGSLRVGLPPGLDAILERCLQKDPGRRYPSCHELTADLRELRARHESGEAGPLPSGDDADAGGHETRPLDRLRIGDVTATGAGHDDDTRPVRPLGASADDATRPVPPPGAGADDATRPVPPPGTGADDATDDDGADVDTERTLLPTQVGDLGDEFPGDDAAGNRRADRAPPRGRGAGVAGDGDDGDGRVAAATGAPEPPPARGVSEEGPAAPAASGPPPPPWTDAGQQLPARQPEEGEPRSGDRKAREDPPGASAARGAGRPGARRGADALRALSSLLRDPRVVAALVLGLVVGALLGGLWAGGEGSAGDAALASGIVRATFEPGPEAWPALTPDGAEVIFASPAGGDWDLYVQAVGQPDAVLLTAASAADDTQPAVAPDGNRVAFRSERDGGGIFVLHRETGTVERLVGQGYNPAWSPDGRHIAFADASTGSAPTPGDTGGGISVIDVAGGSPRPVAGGGAMQPDWSPDGTMIVYWSARTGAPGTDLVVASVDGAPPFSLTDDVQVDWSPAWSPDGSSIVFASRRAGASSLWRLPVDAETGRALGPPAPLTTGGSARGIQPRFARDTGALAYVEDRSSRNLARIPFDAASGQVSGPPQDVTRGAHELLHPDPAPAGDRVAVVARRGTTFDIWIVDAADGRMTPLTRDAATERWPRWSPDGRRVAFLSDREDGVQVWTVGVDGSSARRVTDLRGRTFSAPSWNPAGTSLALSAGGGMLPHFTYMVEERPAPDEQFARTVGSMPGDDSFEPHAWSPDGTLLAGTVRDPAGRAAGIALFDPATGEYRPLTAAGTHPVWHRDGRRLLYRQGSSVWLVDRRSPEPRLVYSAAPDLLTEGLALSRDGRWIWTVLERREADVWVVPPEGARPGER